jgi:hypothetical protein
MPMAVAGPLKIVAGIWVPQPIRENTSVLFVRWQGVALKNKADIHTAAIIKVPHYECVFG